MKRLAFLAALVLAFAAIISAQSPSSAGSGRRAAAPPVAAARPAVAKPAPPPQLFERYCFECHSGAKPEANFSIEELVKLTTRDSVGPYSSNWEYVADRLESEEMPPAEAKEFPTDAERKAAARWIRDSVTTYEKAHAGEPGHVTVRRLTSAEYAYAIRDLTGVDIKVGIDASSDSVGGEGFANFGDVQFVQDASIEHYLEAAKVVASHAVIGSGPLEFFTDAGATGLELSALDRINTLYAAKGFRVVSGEGGRPFGLERYGKAFFVAWYYKHRAALGDPTATLRDLAAKEGITGRFADHLWSVVNKPNPGYPTRETVEAWQKLPSPMSDAQASIAKARAGTDAIYKALTTWPSWFFARGDVAAGGAGDESPLEFNDTTLKAQPTRHYAYTVGPRPAGRGRGAAAPAAGPTRVFLNFTNLSPVAGVTPMVVWRNARVVTKTPPPARGAAPPPGTVIARGGANTVLSAVPLRQALPPDVAKTLAFGTSPDGAAVGPDDFVTTGPVSFVLDVPADGNVVDLEADVELGHDKNTVVRLVISDRAEGSSRDAQQRVLLGDMASAGYKVFRAGMEEYVSLLPPNSHGEANPADKDPVPPPFDNTYNSPEHDAFVLFVKYQRTDPFFTDNMVDGADRARLNQAWNDLFGSWPYHDAYLGMLVDHFKLTLKSRKIQELTPAAVVAQPATVRPYLTALRAHYDQVMKAMTLAQPGHVTDALAFAGRAWRRPLTLTEKTGLQAFYQKLRTTNHLTHEEAIRAVIARVLVSPAFLYRVETVALGPEKQLNGWELASRLSFFLWSSIPDDELRRAAAAGELSNQEGLSKQVKRMTADPKARRVATEFFGQWLGFYHFDEYRGVDTGRFPEFSDAVKTAMYDEAISTFEYLVRQNRPVKEILHADYTFLNKPLAAFYGAKTDVKSTDAVERVDGASAFDRGGALRLGAVLTTTSAPLRTSPVKRGDWVLRRILGTPTPPPPADAGSLPADDKTFAGLTLREKLTEHKRNATCANCHLRIDPLGFPLEGFDAVGRPRTTYSDGKSVDVTGEFADKSTIVGAQGLLKYLDGKDAQVMTTLSKKMIGYALGRTVLASDKPLVESMVAAGRDASFADLATKVVTSRQFRSRVGDTSPSSAGSAPAASRVAAVPPTTTRAGTR